MRPSWVNNVEDEAFQLKGCWARLYASGGQETGTDRVVQVLILRQLGRVTLWLSIIGVCALFSTCKLLTS